MVRHMVRVEACSVVLFDDLQALFVQIGHGASATIKMIRLRTSILSDDLGCSCEGGYREPTPKPCRFNSAWIYSTASGGVLPSSRTSFSRSALLATGESGSIFIQAAWKSGSLIAASNALTYVATTASGVPGGKASHIPTWIMFSPYSKAFWASGSLILPLTRSEMIGALPRAG